jgi:hypothetical protein
VPQLVVTLKYADDSDTADVAPRADIPVEEEAPAASDANEGAGADVKAKLARGMSALGPAFSKIAKRAKTTVALLAAKRGADESAREMPRRTTAPAPGGGLHTAGRRVVRGESPAEAQGEEATTMEPKFKVTKRKVAIAGAAVVAVVLGVIAIRKPHAAPTASASAPMDSAAATATATGANSALAEARHLPMPGAPPAMPGAPNALAANAPPMMPGAASPMSPMSPEMSSDPDGPMGGAASGGKDAKDKKKHGKVTPFGNGPVAHGNILHLKMDGGIDQLQGAQQPTGFTVKVPGRKSLEAAGPLAARDSRIATVKVTNDPAGAELTLTFKDGVPNYQVRAKGDTLEIALAPMGKAHGDKSVAKKSGGKGAGKKHDKSPDKH